jgi:hypothetical protein
MVVPIVAAPGAWRRVRRRGGGGTEGIGSPEWRRFFSLVGMERGSCVGLRGERGTTHVFKRSID